MFINKTDDKNFKDLYMSNLLNEKQWIDIADKLYKSAIIFEPKIKQNYEEALNEEFEKGVDTSLKNIYLMLVSYAIENYLKAIIIFAKKQQIKKDLDKKTELPQCLKSHDLEYLMKEAKLTNIIKSKSFECQLLSKLTSCARWYGRYPVSLKPKDFENNITIPDFEFDVDVIKNLIKNIKNKLPN